MSKPHLEGPPWQSIKLSDDPGCYLWIERPCYLPYTTYDSTLRILPAL